MDIHLNIEESEAEYFRRVTGERNAGLAVAKFLARLVREHGTAQWRAAREKALENYHPSPEAVRGALRSIAELRGKKINVSKSQRKSSRARNPGA